MEISAAFGQIFVLFTPAVGFYDSFFGWNHDTHICFLRKTQKYVERLNSIWIIALYIGIFEIFINILGKCLPCSIQMLVYDHFLGWTNSTQICFSKRCKNKLNDSMIFALYLGMLAIFGNFWVNFCLIHSSRWLSDHCLAWNYGRQIFSFR